MAHENGTAGRPETIKLIVDIATDSADSTVWDVVDTGIPVTAWRTMTDDDRRRCGEEHYRAWASRHLHGGWAVQPGGRQRPGRFEAGRPSAHHAPPMPA
ncbi:hypothetical protein [Nonomuraea sp. NPDC050643]|uniref:hypothetical protein n=1 Tax=Nonomuraea sp. NPDC050643 TaxID=3155660 RepID=UPI0033CBBBDF